MIPDGAWTLTGLSGDGGLVAPVPSAVVTLEVSEGSVAGHGGCNTYRGRLHESDGVIAFGPLITTRMACPDIGVMEQEQRFLEHLARVDGFTQGEGLLELRLGDEVLLTLAPLDKSLEGEWSLVAYNNGRQGVESIPADMEFTALFRDGNLAGKAGCNRYVASYAVDGDTLGIGAAAATRMFCMDPPGVMDMETRYLELLPEVRKYSVRQGRLLDLFDGDGARLLQFTRA
jgi:heat shock protein HslJ